ncbi:MAG: hypothetical protein GY749_02845 [Desulfobacteraceae bacterium]|nr:hypothetical protein [Desulfobacteraceae bacterium]
MNFVKIGKTEKTMDEELYDLVLTVLYKKTVLETLEKEFDRLEGELVERLEEYRGKARSCRLYLGGKENIGFSEEYGNDKIKDRENLKKILGPRWEDMVGISRREYPLTKLKRLARGELEDDPLSASADEIANCLEIKDDRPCLSYKRG